MPPGRTPPKQKPAPPMRSDVVSGSGYAPPKQRPKPKPAPPIVTDTTTSGPRRRPPQRPAPPMVTDTVSSHDQPHPVLQHYGVNLSVNGFNNLIGTTYDLFERTYKRLPSPGLMYDLARAPVDVLELPKLFSVPASDLHASLIDKPAQPPGDPFLKSFEQAIKTNSYEAFVKQNYPALTDYMKTAQGRDELAAAWGRAAKTAPTPALKRLALTSEATLSSEPGAAQSAVPKLQEAGLLPKAIYKAPTGFIGQLVQAMVAAPIGVASLAQAAGLDTWDFVRMRNFDKKPRTLALFEQTGHQVVQDFQHPMKNSGFLFLDVLGFAAPVFGTGARLGAAGRALATKAGVRAGARGLLKKPLPGTYPLTKEGVTGDVLLSENASLRPIQKFILGRRQARIDEGRPSPFSILPGFERFASTEAKIGREHRAASRVAQAALNEPIRRMDRALSWTSVASRAYNKLRHPLRDLAPEESVALIIASIDDANPVNTWRDAQQRWMEQGVGDPKAHKALLALTPKAAKILSDPSPRFQRILAAARDAIQEQEAFKKDALGLSEATAEQRVARAGALFRDEPWYRESLTKSLETRIGKLEATIKTATNEKRKAALTKRVEDYRSLIANVDSENLAAIAEGLGLTKTGAPKLKEGGFVVASDRNNIGRVLDVNTDTNIATVHFLNKASGNWAVKEISVRDLSPIGYRQARRLANRSLLVEEDATGLIDALRLPIEVEPIDLTRVRSDSFYFPFLTARKGRLLSQRPRGVAGRLSPTAGAYGLGPPILPGELTHEFTGSAILAGDIRLDARGLIHETYGRTVRAAVLLDDYNKMFARALPVRPDGPEAKFYEPIRDRRNVSDRMRAVLNAMEDKSFDHLDAESLTNSDLDALRHAFFPSPGEPLDGVKWFDSRLLPDLHMRPGDQEWLRTITKLSTAINEPFRLGALFLRLPYALNAVGNGAMLLFTEGFGSIPAMAESAVARKRWGDRITDALDAQVGEGRTLSYAPGSTFATRTSRGIAEIWSAVVDRQFRRAALIYHLKRLGVKDEAAMERVLFGKAEADRKLLTEAVRRGNKDLVDFSNLTWSERNVVRHVLFVYPWVSRSALWSIRHVLEHPTKTVTLAQLGRLGEQQLEDWLVDHHAKAPSWVTQGGYMPIGNKLVNTNSVNTFSTLAQDIYDVGSLFNHSPYYSVADMLGPAATVTMHAVQGRDQYGNQYAGSPLWNALQETFGQLPQLRAHKGEPGPGKGRPVTSRYALVTKEHQALARSTFIPGFWSGTWGSLIAGPWAPRTPDLEKLTASYWKAQPWQERHAHELKLIEQGVKIQGKVLGRTTPQPVIAAIRSGWSITAEYHKFADKQGRDATPKEKLLITVDWLVKQDQLQNPDHWRKQIRQADPGELAHLSSTLGEQFLNSKDLAAWNRDVKAVLSFTPHRTEKVVQLIGGSASFAGEIKTRLDFGRQYLRFEQDATKAQKRLDAPAYLAWLEQHDKPILVDGKRTLSPVRVAWAIRMDTTEDMQKWLTSAAAGSWAGIPSFVKKQLGAPEPTTQPAALGWLRLAQMMHALQGDQAAITALSKVHLPGYPDGIAITPLPVGHREISREYRNKLAKYVNDVFQSGFKDVYHFAHLPKVDRLAKLAFIQDSPAAPELRSVFARARVMRSYYTKKISTKAAVQDTWNTYLQSDGFQSYLHDNPNLRKELSMFPPTFLQTLVD